DAMVQRLVQRPRREALLPCFARQGARARGHRLLQGESRHSHHRCHGGDLPGRTDQARHPDEGRLIGATNSRPVQLIEEMDMTPTLPSIRGLTRRLLLPALGAASATVTLRSMPASAQAAGDPLPSWNEGAAKVSITEFVSRVTRPRGPGFAPVEQRIATFDNDGTL